MKRVTDTCGSNSAIRNVPPLSNVRNPRVPRGHRVLNPRPPGSTSGVKRTNCITERVVHFRGRKLVCSLSLKLRLVVGGRFSSFFVVYGLFYVYLKRFSRQQPFFFSAKQSDCSLIGVSGTVRRFRLQNKWSGLFIEGLFPGYLFGHTTYNVLYF